MISSRESNKSQSEVIGVVLLLGISIVSIGIILTMGVPIIDNAESMAEYEKVKTQMSLLDSSLSTSALGASEGTSTQLSINRGSLSSHPNESWAKIVYNTPTKTVSVANVSMGSIVYTQDNKEIGYEGGAVWEHNKMENFTRSISKPELHYQGATLTFPVFNIQDRVGVSGPRTRLRASTSDYPNLKFPGNSMDNPLSEGNITVTIKSDYYRGWSQYVEDLTTGEIEKINKDEKKIVFNLSTPDEIQLNDGLMYKNSFSQRGKSSKVDSSQIPSDTLLPDAGNVVNPVVSRCFPNPQSSDCKKLSDYEGDSLQEGETYYIGVEGTPKKLGDYAAPDGNVSIVANGSVIFSENFAVGASSGDEPVELYIDGDVGMSGGAKINTDSGNDVDGVSGSGNPNLFITYITGSVPGETSNGFGNAEYTGVIYAPNTYHGCGGGPGKGRGPGGGEKIAGTPDIKGALIGSSVCVAGNTKIEYDDRLGFLDLTSSLDIVRYLHVTENKIDLSS